jgi:hypothetical protein
MRRPLLLGVLACVTLSAWGGEIIFVDPVREKAQALQLQKDVLEGERVSPAGERAREARDYLNDTSTAPPAVILRNAPPTSDAAKARQAARAWTPPAANTTSGSRCRTENTVGGIEGSVQGHTVIQGSTSDVNSVCK